jgi:hypothetical protein
MGEIQAERAMTEDEFCLLEGFAKIRTIATGLNKFAKDIEARSRWRG